MVDIKIKISELPVHVGDLDAADIVAGVNTSTVTTEQFTIEQIADYVESVLPTPTNPVLTKKYLSSAQTISNAGLLTLAHGLGERPTIVTMYAECTSSEGNYSVGDFVEVSIAVNSNGASGRANGIELTSSNIIIRFAKTTVCFLIANKNDGTNLQMTNSKWDLFVRAYA